jgi:hypothetical protein
LIDELPNGQRSRSLSHRFLIGFEYLTQLPGYGVLFPGYDPGTLGRTKGRGPWYQKIAEHQPPGLVGIIRARGVRVEDVGDLVMGNRCLVAIKNQIGDRPFVTRRSAEAAPRGLRCIVEHVALGTISLQVTNGFPLKQRMTHPRGQTYVPSVTVAPVFGLKTGAARVPRVGSQPVIHRAMELRAFARVQLFMFSLLALEDARVFDFHHRFAEDIVMGHNGQFHGRGCKKKKKSPPRHGCP